VARWRNFSAHRAAQEHGRDGVFDEYRLRVVSVLRDYGMFDRREQAPADSRSWHEK
jgi:heme-degrading monooxygenase HmoA